MTAYFVDSTIRILPIFLLASMGGLIAERGGVATLCLEGLMLIGAFAAVATVHWTGNLILGVTCAAFVSCGLAAIHAYLSITARVNQFVSGIIVNVFAATLTSFLLQAIFNVAGATKPVSSTIYSFSLSPITVGVCILMLVTMAVVATLLLPKILRNKVIKVDISHRLVLIAIGLGTVVGILLMIDQGNPIRVSLIAVFAALLYGIGAWVMTRTWVGNWITACGESEITAASCGIPIQRLRWLCVLTCGLLCGIAGAYLSTGVVDVFRKDMTAGRGFLAVAAVVFGLWRPGRILLACFLISMLEGFQTHLQSISWWPTQISQFLPYIVVLSSLFLHRGQGNAPSELGRLLPVKVKPIPPRIGIILATGSRQDSSINQYVWELWKKGRITEKTGIRTLRPLGPPHSIMDIGQSLRKLRRDCMYIVGLGSFMEKSFIDFIKERMHWHELAIVDGGILDDKVVANNSKHLLMPLLFKETKLAAPAGYLAAALAERMRGTKATVGFLGGVELPVVTRWATGFRRGVKKYNELYNCSINTEVDFLGTSYSAFADIYAGTHVASYYFEWRDVCVIMEACGAACSGVIKAADEYNKWNQDKKCLIISADYIDKQKSGSPVAFGVIRRIEDAIASWVNDEPFEPKSEEAGIQGLAWDEYVREKLKGFTVFEKEWKNACKKTR